jgi:hypothetical protein
MAKVNVEYDTVEKTASVTIDGKPIENISSIAVYCGYSFDDEDEPMFCLDMTTLQEDKENKMISMNRTTASVKQPEKPSLQSAIAQYIFPSA